MKNFFRLLVVAVAATALFSGCQNYDDSQIRQEIKDLGDRVAALEAWTRNSQEAVDYVAVLKEAVKNMNSIESVDVFEDEHGSGYVITFTDKQTIKLYNGKDGDTFFGNVNVGTSCVEFILADGTSFFVDRVTSSISFDSFETKAVTKGSTVWTVMNENFKKEEFAAITAELKADDGTATSIATKSAADDNPWKIKAIAPEFGEDGKLVKPAGVIFRETPKAGSKGVLKVALITNDGKESAASIVVEAVPNYLSFEAVEAGATVSMNIVGQCPAPSLEYSTDLDEWITFDFGNPKTITLENVGDKVYWRNTDKTDHFSSDAQNYVHFKLGDKKIAASGNIMSLIDKSCESKTIPSDYCFVALFLKSTGLTEAPELPVTTLSVACYYCMFYGCSSLKAAPELPATEMADSCYYGMFYECRSLKEAPALPAEKLSPCCYRSMFYDNHSLKKAPALPAKELAGECYSRMFYGCSSLESAPALPATVLFTECYYGMFVGCKSLKEAHALPATELACGCYKGMFEECTSLKKAPALPAKQLAESCYLQMFYGCTSLEEAPELPATELAPSCYYLMFPYCTSLKETPALPAMELAPACYIGMFIHCTSLKKAPELPAMKLEPFCYNLMFQECTSLEEVPELPATELAEGCYYSMFEECTFLKKAPELPATKLATSCYAQMFLGCTSLKEACALPATELAEECYRAMFLECTSLKEACALPATELAEKCYKGMFFGCTSLTEAPALPATKLVKDCYYSMFDTCHSLETAPDLPADELAVNCYAGMFWECLSLESAPYLPAERLVSGCYDSIFYGCSNLKSINVAFTDWGDGSATPDWVAGVAAKGNFECPEGLEVRYGDSFIPSGWRVNGVAPAAAKSLSVPAKRAAGVIRCKPEAPKFPEIQDRVIDHGMMAQ